MMYRSRYLHFVWGVSKVIAAIWIYTVLIEHLHKMFSELITNAVQSSFGLLHWRDFIW